MNGAACGEIIAWSTGPDTPGLVSAVKVGICGWGGGAVGK